MSENDTQTRAQIVASALAVSFALGAGGFYWGLQQGQNCIDELKFQGVLADPMSEIAVNAECQFFDY